MKNKHHIIDYKIRLDIVTTNRNLVDSFERILEALIFAHNGRFKQSKVTLAKPEVIK